MDKKLSSGIMLTLLLTCMLHIILNVRPVVGWSNGGFSTDPQNPNYGTHDWIAHHALDWLPDLEKEYIVNNLAIYLYGTELPDNGGAPDGIGDTALHHIYYWSNESLQDDASAVRAQTEYDNALNYMKSDNVTMAVKTLGIMSHYVVDVGVFGHVMGSETDWGPEVHHSDYESYVNERTNSYNDEFDSYLAFDGNLGIIPAYDAARVLAYDTTFDVDGDLTCVWMDENYDWNNQNFKDRCGESLNLAVNLLAEVLHTFYMQTIGFQEDFSSPTLDPAWQVWKYSIPAPSPPEATYQQETRYSLTDNPGRLRYYLGSWTVHYLNESNYSTYWYYPSIHIHRTFEGTEWVLEAKITYYSPYSNAWQPETYIRFDNSMHNFSNFINIHVGSGDGVEHYIRLVDNGVEKVLVRIPIFGFPVEQQWPYWLGYHSEPYVDTVYYRIIRSGYQFTVMWSNDGVSYNTVFNETMGSQIDGLPQFVDITGQAFWSDPNAYSEYDYIYITPPFPWSDWTHYHNYSEIVNTLFYLNLLYPNLVDVFSIGKSWQNRDIYCIRLTNESNTHPKPKLLFVGYHHARELISAELPLYFAVEAATNFGTNETITHMLNNSEIYIVPALNVDAFNIVKQNEWQRKNVHPFDEDGDGLLDEDPPDDEDGDGYIEDLYFWNGTYYEFIRWEGRDDDGDGLLNEDWVGGVDLNRNYGYQWDAPCQSGSPYPWAEDYRGPTPFSEPETQAIRDLALGPYFKYTVSFHSGTEVIGYPWGYTTDPTPDDATFREIAANLSALIGAPYGQNSGLYTASGMWEDWMYANRSTFALTCEIYGNNSAWQYEPGPEPYTWWEKGVFQFFNPDPSQIETVIQRWLPVFTYITNRAITEAYDIATTNVTPLKTIVGQGYSMHINVTVTNQGEFTENFNVTAYANTTIIETKEVTLTSGNSTTVTFTWNTTGVVKGNYTIKAEATQLLGETDTDDNTLIDGWVFVTIPGDVNGDKIVNIKDAVLLGVAFGAKHVSDPTNPKYCQYWHTPPCGTCPHNPNADISCDGFINIKDAVIQGTNFGKSWT